MKYIRNTAGNTWTNYKTNIRDCKGMKYNPSFGQNTGLLMKLDTTCKQNALWQVTQDNKQWQTKSRNQGRPTKRHLDVWDRNRSSSDPTPRQLDDDDDIQMDFKKKGDGKARTGFIWLTIGTVVIYKTYDTVQQSTNTECWGTWLPEIWKSHHLTMTQTMGITNLNASHSLLLFYPKLLWTMSTSPKCMPLVKVAAISMCGNEMGNIRKCTGMGSVKSAGKCGAGVSKGLPLISPQMHSVSHSWHLFSITYHRAISTDVLQPYRP
jgi:hypothetical protein